MNLEDSKPDIGVCETHIYYKNGKAVFEKSFPLDKKLNFLKTIENVFLDRLILGFPLHKHLKRATPRENLNKEVKTNELWKKEGIHTIDLIGIEDGKISWQYIPNSKSIRQKLLEEDSSSYSRFLEVYRKVRDLAVKNNDSDYLHSDPHLANFLVHPEGEVFPIDSGCLLNRKMSVSELNTYLLYRTFNSLYVENLVPVSNKKYTKEFGNSLSKLERENLLDFQPKISNISRAYFLLREPIASRINKRERSDIFNNYKKFEKDWNNYIKEALE